jgi:hypothetical protein
MGYGRSDPQRVTFGSPGWRLSFSGGSADDLAQAGLEMHSDTKLFARESL